MSDDSGSEQEREVFDNAKMVRRVPAEQSQKPPAPSQPAKVQKVIKGPVGQRKKTFFNQLSNALFGEDTRDVGSYIFWDILVPAAKNMLYDMVVGGIEMRLFGGESKNRTSHLRRERSGSYVSYNNYYDSNRNRPEQHRIPDRTREPRSVGAAGTTFNFEDIRLSKGDAEVVLDTLIDYAEQYGVVKVSDFCDAVGIDYEFTALNYGWTDQALEKAYVSPARGGGYIVNLPRPFPLERN